MYTPQPFLHYNHLFNNNFVPITAPTPLPFYNNPINYDFSALNNISNINNNNNNNNINSGITTTTNNNNSNNNGVNSDCYRYSNSISKNFSGPGYKYEEITFELPTDYYSSQPTATYTVREYNNSNSRPSSTRPQSRNRPITPYINTQAPEPLRVYTPNHAVSYTPTPAVSYTPTPSAPDVNLRKLRKSRPLSRYRTVETPTRNYNENYAPQNQCNLNAILPPQRPSSKSGNYNVSSEYYMNAYNAQSAPTPVPQHRQQQQQQNQQPQQQLQLQLHPPQTNFSISSEYLQKPLGYYDNNNNTTNNNNSSNNNCNSSNSGYNSGRLSAIDVAKIQQLQQRAPSTTGTVHFENASATQISYFDTGFNPNLKSSDGRISRRQKSTPSTVHFASPLVTPIPYCDQYELKENNNPNSNGALNSRRHKETQSHTTIQYRNPALTPVNYSFETNRMYNSNDQRQAKKYRPNTPASAYHQIIDTNSNNSWKSTPNQQLLAPTPIQGNSATNTNCSSGGGNKYIRFCYLKSDGSNEYECKNIKIKDEHNTNFVCNLDDLKKKKKMKFLGVFKENPETYVNEHYIEKAPESRIKYMENEPPSNNSQKKRINIPIMNNNQNNQSIYMNHNQNKYNGSNINEYIQNFDSNDSSYGIEEIGIVEQTFNSKRLEPMPNLKTSSSREKLYKLIKDSNGLVLLKEIS